MIEAVDGKAVAGADELSAVMTEHKPGDTVTLTVLSGGTTKQVKATLGVRPSGA